MASSEVHSGTTTVVNGGGKRRQGCNRIQSGGICVSQAGRPAGRQVGRQAGRCPTPTPTPPPRPLTHRVQVVGVPPQHPAQAWVHHCSSTGEQGGSAQNLSNRSWQKTKCVGKRRAALKGLGEQSFTYGEE